MFFGRLKQEAIITPFSSRKAVQRQRFFYRPVAVGARCYTTVPTAAHVTNSLGKPPEPRLSLTFTCTAPNCSHRSTHEFSKASYERGIVLVQCPGCKNRHLIADHLGWFKEHKGTAGGTLRTIEDLMAAKGEKVTRGRLDAGGIIEYADK